MPPSVTASDLAPTGKLRAAINFGNPVLAGRDATGEPRGISVDLARELARRLGVAIEFVPYDVIEGVYLVAEASPVRSNAEVDRPGKRVGVIVGSAYDLHLSRELKQATIVRAASSDAVMDLWVARKLDAVAGVKPQLKADAKRISGLRMLPGRFMASNRITGAAMAP